MKKIICYLLLSALLINVALNSNAFKIYGAEDNVEYLLGDVLFQ